MAINLKPFRVYDEHDVVNLYAYSGAIGISAGDKIPKGTLVKVQGDGWKNTDEPTEMLGNPGASYNGTVSQRYGTTAKVCQTSSGNVALGVTLHDIAEVDENGELLKFNPRKAAEMEVAISGQTVPVLTKVSFCIRATRLALSLPELSFTLEIVVKSFNITMTTLASKLALFLVRVTPMVTLSSSFRCKPLIIYL